MNLPPCPHPGDPSHAGLGKVWCDAGREGQALLAAKQAKRARLRAGADMSSKRLRMQRQHYRRLAAQPVEDLSVAELLGALIQQEVTAAVERAVLAVVRIVADRR